MFLIKSQTYHQITFQIIIKQNYHGFFINIYHLFTRDIDTNEKKMFIVDKKNKSIKTFIHLMFSEHLTIFLNTIRVLSYCLQSIPTDSFSFFFLLTWDETWSDRGGVSQQNCWTVFVQVNECSLDIYNNLNQQNSWVENDRKNNIKTPIRTSIK